MISETYGNLRIFLNKRRFAISFISTYIIIAALPILVFGFVLNEYMLQLFETKIQERDRELLRQFVTTTDNNFQSLVSVATLIYMDTDLSAHKLDADPINAMEGVKTLRKYTSSYATISNVLLYTFPNDRFYTSETVISADDFFQVYKFKGLTIEILRDLIKNNNKIFISQPYELQTTSGYLSRRFTLVTIPMPASAATRVQMVFFMVDINNLYKTSGISNRSMFVFTADGQLLIPDQPSTLLSASADEIPRMIDPNKPGQELQLDDQMYTMHSLISKSTGLQFVSLIPKEVTLSEINSIRTVYLFVFLILTGILIPMVVMSKQLHLKPLQALFSRAQRIAGRSPDQPVSYKTVSSAFDYMIDQQATMKMKYDSARTAIREHLLIQLLGNEIVSIAEFNELGYDVGMHFSHDSFFIATLRLNTDELRSNRQLIAAQLESSDSLLAGYTLQMPDDQIVAFYCLDYTRTELESDYFRHIKDSLAQHGLFVDIGVGNTYPDISQIAESYSEANSALDYQSVRGGGVMFFRTEIGNTDWFDLEYPTKKIHLLEALLLEGDTDKISSTVNEISEFMDRQNLPLSAVRCLNYDIINTLLRTMRVISHKDATMKNKILDIMALSGFDSSKDLKQETQRICVEICEHIRKTNESRIDNLVIRILEYVNKHYCSTNFSICTMANDLDLSLSLVNTCFKKFMDKTPLEYVTEMRLNLAKQLIVATSLSLSEITHQVGYIDTPSFLRKFHKLTGITPGQYRKMHAAQPENAAL